MKKSIRNKWLLALLGLPVIFIGKYLINAQFKGNKEHITLHTDLEIEGLLLRPDSPGPYPAVLLLHGSGGSHQKYDKLYFRFHANAFLKKGFAVLIYTKRGSGKNNFDYRYFTYNQLLNDAHQALQFLRNQKDIDQDKIGIMGVSESGWFTPELALLDGNIKFIINRVSSPFSVSETIAHEVRMDALAEGFTDEEVDKHILPLTREIWQFYIDVSRDPTLAHGPQRTAINKKLNEIHRHERLGEWFTSEKLSDYDSLRYAARGQNLAYDPLPYLRNIDTPIFYIVAGNDRNIPSQKVVDFLEDIRQQEGKDITIKVYPNASHYLYKYGLRDGPYEGWLYPDGYPQNLVNWAMKTINRQ